MRKECLLASALLAGLFLVGCAHQPKTSETPNTGTMQEPQWLSKGVSTFPEEMGKTFFGVGIAEARMYPGVSLRRTTAMARARADVVSQLRTMVSSVLKDYQKACFSKQMKEGELGVVTESIVKNVADETIYGSEPRDVWTNPSTGDIYVLMAVSSESIAQRLRGQIAFAERDRLSKDADAAHKDLDQIIDRYRQQPPK